MTGQRDVMCLRPWPRGFIDMTAFIVAFWIACQSFAEPPSDGVGESGLLSRPSAAPEIVPQLSTEDFTLAIEPRSNTPPLPGTIRIRFLNRSKGRGYIELPMPMTLPEKSPAEGPWLAIGMKAEGNAGETIFVHAIKKPPCNQSQSIAVLDAGQSTVMEYSTDSFCLIGHGVEPECSANLATCFGSGEVLTEMRVYYIDDWSKLPPKRDPNPVVFKTSPVDLSKHTKLKGETRNDNGQ